MKRKINIKDGDHGDHGGFSIGTILPIFCLATCHPDASNQVLSQLAQGFGRSKLLQQFVDAERQTTHDARHTTDIDQLQ